MTERQEPVPTLGRSQAIALAIASIAGSGILFLPSAVYVHAGRNSLLVWGSAVLVCLPMLLMFEDMVRTHPSGQGIQAFIGAALGDGVGRCVPIMFLAVVPLGLPAGALVAGHYVARAVGGGDRVMVLTAVGVLAVGVTTNLAGARANVRLQHGGSWALIAMALVLSLSAATRGAAGASTVTPVPDRLDVVLPGVVLAFWAFSGFENLTFLSRELRRPERDFLPVTAIALGTYGLLTILLTVAIAVRVPRRQVDDVGGLLQLADTMQPRPVVLTAVTLIAVGAVVLNTVAWVWGTSRLLAAAASSSILPRALAPVTEHGVPRRVILLLTVLFAVALTVLVVIPGTLVDGVAAASAIFVLLYVLSILSYLRVRGLTARALANLLPLVVLVAGLVQSGWRSMYGLVVLVGALVVQRVRRRRRFLLAERPAGLGLDEPGRDLTVGCDSTVASCGEGQ